MSSDRPEPEDSPDEVSQGRTGFPGGGVSAAAASRALAQRLAGEEQVVEGDAARTEETVGERDSTWPQPDQRAPRPLASAGDLAQEIPASAAAAPASDTGAAPPRRRLWAALALSIAILLLTALGASVYLAVTNKSRADRWQERAFTLEHNVDELNGLLVERSNTLNARTRELNRMAAKVREQRSALRRSEADVSSLAQRQRALAAEKAEVEDSRAQLAVQASALENVADAFVDCKDGLVDLLGYVLDEDYYSANAVISGVASDCRYAESALSDYNATYP